MDELHLYNGGGDIKIKDNSNNKNLSEIEKRKIRLKERIRIFTEELKRLENIENNDKK
jgi:hypothetical protein